MEFLLICALVVCVMAALSSIAGLICRRTVLGAIGLSFSLLGVSEFVSALKFAGEIGPLTLAGGIVAGGLLGMLLLRCGFAWLVGDCLPQLIVGHALTHFVALREKNPEAAIVLADAISFFCRLFRVYTSGFRWIAENMDREAERLVLGAPAQSWREVSLRYYTVAEPCCCGRVPVVRADGVYISAAWDQWDSPDGWASDGDLYVGFVVGDHLYDMLPLRVSGSVLLWFAGLVWEILCQIGWLVKDAALERIAKLRASPAPV